MEDSRINRTIEVSGVLNSNNVADTTLSPSRKNTLRKGEKLRHRSLVEQVFSSGRHLYEFPLRLSYKLLTPEELSNSFRIRVPDRVDKLQMLITVPKKKRKRAVDRVLIRRRIREAYRLNRHSLKDSLNFDSVGTLSMAIVYMCDKNLPYHTIEKKLKLLLKKLEDIVNDSKS